MHGVQDRGDDFENRVSRRELAEAASRALHHLSVDYDIGPVVGAGGGGVVYQATRRLDGSEAALKIVGFDSSDAQRRWTREVGSLGRVSHRNVASLLDYAVIEEAASAYVATRFVRGPTFEGWLNAETGVSRAEGAALVLQVLKGLAAVHEAGLAHRDVKSTNVVIETVSTRRSAVLVDFGIAHSYSTELTPWSRLTHPGSFIGTADYVAPERIQGAPGDARADVWSVGILLHRVLYGYMPFRARTPSLTLVRAVAEPLLVPWRSDEGIDASELALFEVVTRALDKRPENRFADAASMRAALEDVVGDGGRIAPAVSWQIVHEEDTKPIR
jgi:serine/threonine protein kinase